jgi:hypothetical protein
MLSARSNQKRLHDVQASTSMSRGTAPNDGVGFAAIGSRQLGQSIIGAF